MIKLEVKTHDDEIYTKEVEDYDAQKLNDEINNNEVLTVVIGDLIISRINIAKISVISEE